jgi:ADP-dependent NAD(P)H-hydrate dehydratase
METPIIIDKNEILHYYKKENPQTHKGIQGHALIIGGSYGKMGSVCLCAKAALKSGCGLVTAYIPKCDYDIVQISIPEAMVITDDYENNITTIDFQITPQAIGIGIGMGQDNATQNAFHLFLKSNETPLVIDADALNILSLNKEWLSLLPPKTILTPHQKELERLIGNWHSDLQRNQMVQQFSKQYDIIVIMKDAPTQIFYQNKYYQNTTGNAALATAGSGDVLTGIITSLLAQNYQPIEAAKLGVYLHGLTATLALPKTGYQSFIASDIINYLGEAFLSLEH